MNWNRPNPDLRFQIGDLIKNIHTGKIAQVFKRETQWAIPVYEVHYLGSGKTLRFNLKYEQNWELHSRGEEE